MTGATGKIGLRKWYRCEVQKRRPRAGDQKHCRSQMSKKHHDVWEVKCRPRYVRGAKRILLRESCGAERRASDKKVRNGKRTPAAIPFTALRICQEKKTGQSLRATGHLQRGGMICRCGLSFTATGTWGTSEGEASGTRRGDAEGKRQV